MYAVRAFHSENVSLLYYVEITMVKTEVMYDFVDLTVIFVRSVCLKMFFFLVSKGIKKVGWSQV